MSVSKRLRYEVLRRDNHRCRYCGTTANESELRVDHVVPVTLGGDDEPSNLVASCHDCNAGKSSASPDASQVEDVEQDALRWSQAMQKAQDIAKREREEVAIQLEQFDDAWRFAWDPVMIQARYEPERGWHNKNEPERIYEVAVHCWNTSTGETWVTELFDDSDSAEAWIERKRELRLPPRPKDWQKKVKQWIAAGMGANEFQALVDELVEDRDYIEWDRKWSYLTGMCWGQVRRNQAVARALLDAGEEGS